MPKNAARYLYSLRAFRPAAHPHRPTPIRPMRKASSYESPLICLSVGRVVDVQQSDLVRGRVSVKG